MKIKVSLEKTITEEEYIKKVHRDYNDIEKNVQNIIFTEMIENILPLKITIDDSEEECQH